MKTSIKIMLSISVFVALLLMISVADMASIAVGLKRGNQLSDSFCWLTFILVVGAVIGWCGVGIKSAIENRHLRTSARAMIVITVLLILSFLVGIVWFVYGGSTYAATEWGWVIPWMLYGICLIVFAMIVVLGWIVVGIKAAISKPNKKDE